MQSYATLSCLSSSRLVSVGLFGCPVFEHGKASEWFAMARERGEGERGKKPIFFNTAFPTLTSFGEAVTWHTNSKDPLAIPVLYYLHLPSQITISLESEI